MQGCQAEIVTGREPDGMVRFAAEELRDYVERLFGIRAKIGPAPSEAEATFFLDAAAAGLEAPEEDRDRAEYLRILALAVLVACYIGCLHLLAFQHGFTILGVYFTLSAFEPTTIIALATIIHVFWGGPIWITTSISVGWTLVLSVVFQKVFVIPLPGGF